jgi:hypothetical protein
MAIVPRTATLAENASATTITGTRPTDRVAGDLVVVSFHMSCTVAQFTGPGGSWVQWVAPTANFDSQIVAVYYQFDPASDPVGTSSGVAGRVTAICQAYGGVDPTTPSDVAPQISTATGTPLAVTSITTATNGARLVSGATINASTGTWTVPGGMTLVKAHTSGIGRGGVMGDETFATAGVTGTRSWVFSVGSLSMVGYLAALRPAPAATVSALARLTQPGRTWERRYRHPQMPPTVSAVAPAVPAEYAPIFPSQYGGYF